MNLKDFYSAAQGSYEDVMGRLLTEQRVLKYLKRIPDMPDYAEMKNAFAAGNWEIGFRTSHSIKGVALNLGLTGLGAKASAVCETVRHGAPAEDPTPLVNDLCSFYDNTCALIAQL